jgi:hypothetical protein
MLGNAGTVAMPAVMDVWRGNDHFATFEITSVRMNEREGR